MRRTSHPITLLALTIFLAVCVQNAFAELSKPEWIFGRLYTDHFYGVADETKGDFVLNSVSMWLGVEGNIFSNLSTKIVGQVDVPLLYTHSITQPKTSYRFREANITWDMSPGTQLRVGQEIIPWGKSDGVNPTDYLSGKDYTLRNPDDEVKRVGAIGAHLSYTPLQGNSPLLFEGVFQVNYARNQMLIPQDAIPATITVVSDQDAPSVDIDHFQGALKASYLGTAFDFSLSYFSGREKFPQFFYTGGTTVVTKNIEIQAFGGDFSATLDKYVIRMEGAYTKTEYGPYGYKNQGVTEPDHLDIVVGAERPLGDDFRTNLQFMVRHHPKFASAESYVGTSNADTVFTRQVAAANALILNFQKKTRPGMTFRVGYEEPTKAWSADLSWVGNLDGSDYLFRPVFAWTKIENVKLSLGADLYGGERNRPFGALAPYNAVFFDAKYFF